MFVMTVREKLTQEADVDWFWVSWEMWLWKMRAPFRFLVAYSSSQFDVDMDCSVLTAQFIMICYEKNRVKSTLNDYWLTWV